MKTAITLIIGVIIGFGLSVLYSGSDAERIVKERQAEVVGSVASNFMARQSDPVDSRATVKTVAGLNHIPVEIEVIDDNILRATGIANTFLIRTDEGIVLFDTGLGTQSAKHKRLLQEAAPGPVTHIVLSHSHADHIGGTNFWLDEFPDATVITHEKFLTGQRYLKDLEPYFWSRNRLLYTFMPETPPEAPSFLSYGGIKPDVLIRNGEKYEFVSGGITFTVLPTPGAEGDDNLVLWLGDRRALFSGDFFGPLFPMVPSLFTLRGEKFRDPGAYIDSLSTLIELKPNIILPSHFDPITGADQLKADMTRMREATRYIHDQTLAGMNTGKSLWQLMEDVQLPPALALSEGHGKVSWNVRSIWEHYSTWFHFDSTTALYNVPVRTIYPDLSELAGGAERLLERAATKLDAGNLEQALHFIEVAESSAPDNLDVQRAKLEVLELMLDRAYDNGSNYSETGWLGRQVDITIERLTPSD